jgi:hypothetical protein
MDHRIDGANLIPKRNAKHQFRQHIFEAWQHCCAYCGASADTLDHIKPRHKGGGTVATNLVPACTNCNRKKGSEDWIEWFTKQQFYCVNKANQIRQWMRSSDAKTP